MKRLLASVLLLPLLAGPASAAPAKQGGIFRVGTTGASVQIDPQVSYVTPGWWLEYATAAKLYNYPDKAGQAGAILRPEVSAGLQVSNAGTVYTFAIRKGFRFSDGSPVTARDFVYAIKRTQNPTLNSPGAQLASNIASATASGGRLVIRLKTPNPALLSTLAMPFFQATSTKLPLSQEVTSGYPSAGPYYFSHNEVNVLTSIRRNPHWHGDRPRHLDGVDLRWNMNEQDAYQQTLANKLDEGPIPAAQVQDVVDRFGVNKSRFWAKPVQCVSYVYLNNASGVFAGNAPLRKAVNWAIDRTDYVGANSTLTVAPWTHLLSPATPGSITAKRKQPYSARANLAKARELAAGHLGTGKVVVLYRLSGTINPHQAQVVQQALLALGFDSARIEMKGLAGAQIYDFLGVRGAVYDVAVGIGWCADYPDAFGQSQLGGLLAAVGNDNPTYRKKIAAAEKLPLDRRPRALGKLDVEIMKSIAPVAPMAYYNSRFLFSNRVDPRSLVYQPVYSDFSIPALRLK